MPETSIDYASKYAQEIDERFSQVSLTDAATNDGYDFDGVNTVKIRSVDTVPLNDYNMQAETNRYGTPVEIGSSVQSMTLTQDKSFTFSIDRRNHDDTMMTHEAGAAMDRQIREVIVPYVDRYRLSVLAKNAATVKVEDITPENAYTSFLDSSRELFDKKVPVEGRIAFVSPAYYRCIKLDKNFTKTGDKALEVAVNGAVGKIDNIAIVVVPSDYLPDGVNYIITHPSAMVAPKKIADYKQHTNPQGINGWLVEGRVYFDAFVLKNKRRAILVSKATVYAVTFTVKDDGESEIPGAQIYIAGRELTTTQDGTAAINLPNGDYAYNVICDGYSAVIGSLTVKDAIKSEAVTMTADE